MIASVETGAGKTTVASGLMAALARRGLRVQGFKVGPDFIDPTYHMAATGRRPRNLDTWLLPSRRVLQLFLKASGTADISVIEGVMGLFDGLGAGRWKASTAELAKLLRTPVILVVDVSRMAASAAAIVEGVRSLDKSLDLKGVILNRVAGPGHAQLCSRAIEGRTGIPVLGSIPLEPRMQLPERHLGLVPTPEDPEVREKLGLISHIVAEQLDLEGLLEIAGSAPPPPQVPGRRRAGRVRGGPRVAVAYDEAFNFYYWDGLEQLEELGAELAFFSPLHDTGLPEGTAAVYIGGGFPELHAGRLEENQAMRKTLRRAAEEEMPIYCECGGLMYMTRSLTTFHGERRAMVGLLEADTVMGGRLTINYTLAETIRPNPLAPVGRTLRGHEFHHSQIQNVPADATFTYRMRLGRGIKDGYDGWLQHQVLAQYTHIHLAGHPEMARGLLRAARSYMRR